MPAKLPKSGTKAPAAFHALPSGAHTSMHCSSASIALVSAWVVVVSPALVHSMGFVSQFWEQQQ